MRAVIVSRVYADPASRGKLKALAGQGVSVTAVVPDRWTPVGLQLEQKTVFGEDGAVRTVPVPIRGRSEPDADPRWSAKALRRVLTDVRPDLMQIEEDPWSRGAATAASLARRLRVPYVVLARDSLPGSYSPLVRFRRSRVLVGARGLIAVNGLAARLITRHYPQLPHLVLPQLGVPVPASTVRSPHSGLSIGFLGRLIPEKGLDLLFRACVKLIGRWTLTVVGTGPAQEELEGLAERLGIAGRVTWLGPLPRDRVQQVWPGLDCVVLPSRTAPRWVEAMPRAALEAMAHGLPVVASSTGALPEIVDAAGVVVPEEDVPALTAALQRLHDDDAERMRLGADARRRVMEHFSDAAVAGKTLRFWRETVGATA